MIFEWREAFPKYSRRWHTEQIAGMVKGVVVRDPVMREQWIVIVRMRWDRGAWPNETRDTREEAMERAEELIVELVRKKRDELTAALEGIERMKAEPLIRLKEEEEITNGE